MSVCVSGSRGRVPYFQTYMKTCQQPKHASVLSCMNERVPSSLTPRSVQFIREAPPQVCTCLVFRHLVKSTCSHLPQDTAGRCMGGSPGQSGPVNGGVCVLYPCVTRVTCSLPEALGEGPALPRNQLPDLLWCLDCPAHTLHLF